MNTLSRRTFLGTSAAASLAKAAGAGPMSPYIFGDDQRALPSPQSSGIEHIVLVTMENRSFDHILGWLPHANGRQQGLTNYDKAGAFHPTYHLTDYQNCALADPDHSSPLPELTADISTTPFRSPRFGD